MSISDFLLEDSEVSEGGGFAESDTEAEDFSAEAGAESGDDAVETPTVGYPGAAEKGETAGEEPGPSTAPDPVRKKLIVLEEQNRLLQSQLEELKNRPAVQEKKDFHYEPATEEDWAEDPNKAFQKNLRAELSKIQAEQQKMKAGESEKQREGLQQKQQAAWNQVVSTVPAFETDPDLRAAFVSVFYNKANNFADDPNGPMMAASYVVQKMGLGSTPAGNTKPTSDVSPAGGSPAAGRTARVKQAAMHGSGRGGTAKVKALDPEYARVARRLGVSEQSMRETLESGVAA